MSRWQNNALQVIFKVVILAAAGVVAITIRATFHFQSDHLTGITFFVSAIGLYLVFQRVFPSVYGRSGLPADRLWTKKMFYSGGEVAIDVRDVAAAQRWYSEKLGLGYSSAIVEIDEGSMVLGYTADDPVIYLAKISDDRPSSGPGRQTIMFARKLRTNFCLRGAWRSALYKTTLAVINCFTSEIWKGTNWKCVSNLKVMQRPSRKLAC
jgi:hypothetical protein